MAVLALLAGLAGLALAQEPEEVNSTSPPAGRESKVVEELKYKQHPGLAYAASKIYFSDKRYSISGYGEVNAVKASEDQSAGGGDLELYYTNLYRFSTFLGYKIKPNLIFNFEFLGEFPHDGHGSMAGYCDRGDAGLSDPSQFQSALWVLSAANGVHQQ